MRRTYSVLLFLGMWILASGCGGGQEVPAAQVPMPEPVSGPESEPAPDPVDPPPAETTYELTVTTEPAHMCAVYIDGMKAENNVGNAPVTVSLAAGSHTVHFMIAPGRYSLAGTNPMEIDLQADMTVSMPLKEFKMGPE